MRETQRLGTFYFATVTLLACIACPHLLFSQEPAPDLPTPAVPPQVAPAPVEPALVPGADAVADPSTTPPLAEPISELPASTSPQIEAITLFPNQVEINSGAKFNDQRFGYVLHGEIKAAYESNIFIAERDEQEDFIFTISPGVAVGWGEFKSELYGPDSFRHRFEQYAGKNFFYLDYSPGYTWFVDHGDQDTFDHNARLEGEWTIQRLTLGAHASYVTENVPVEDLGTRVERTTIAAALTSSYEYSGKTSFEINGYFNELKYESNGVDSSEWRNEDWMNYQVSPKIKLGLGGVFAMVDREVGPSQNYEQGRLRVVYESSEKLTISLIGGAEWRQTDGGEDRSAGIFLLDLAWAPFDGSYFYLQGYRRSVTGSGGANDYYLATGFMARYQQRLFQRYYLSLTTGYQNSDYQNSEGSAEVGRTDDLFFIRPGIAFDLSSWLSCEISGEFRQNDSTIERRGFEAAKATVRFNVLF
jgi:hypothetical protein